MKPRLFLLQLLWIETFLCGTTTSLSFVTMSAKAATAAVQPKIAVIGGGAAGLAAARAAQNAGWTDITVLEKDARTGGVWNYQTAATDRPVYRGLRTNLPKEIMAFPEFPWKGPSQSFVTHAQVLDYLYDYQQHFDLQKYIHTGCTVQHLKVLTTTGDNADQPVSCLSPETEHWPRIRLDWTIAESDGTAASVSREFDAVCVCNGHYGVPAVPELDGLKEHYKGRLMHSIAYDDPAVFAGQKVLCIGGRASGSDLAREIAVHADAVYLSDSVAPPMDETGTPVTKYNVAWVPKTTAVLADGSVQFDLGCNMNPVVDVIVFCTGYDYSFPFIDEETSNISLDFATGSRRVQPVLEQFWHAVNPNICFAGLPHSVLPFPLFELQMTAAVRQWQDWTLPTDKASRMVMAAKDAASGGEGMVNGRMPQDTHFLGPAQWDYCRRMAEYAGTYDDEMENYIATNKVIYKHRKSRGGDFPAGPDDYRDICYKRDDAHQTFQSWTVHEANTEGARLVVPK